jgi:RimJ/RimL family protein N-acetyltransferase
VRGRSYGLVVAATETMTVRALVIADLEVYLRHSVEVDAGSGLDGEGHSHPYSKSEPLDLDAARDRETSRWSTEIDRPGWRRAWGLFDHAQLVGHIHLAGGALDSELHRADLGMGIVRSHRRRGGGTLLLQTAIAWARCQPGIDWLDLGVFSDNPGGQALYARHGFQVLGRTPDRFRVDGCSLDDLSMTLSVVGDCS